MTRLVLLISLFIWPQRSLHAQVAPPELSDVRAIEAVERALEEALTRGDRAALERLLAEDFAFIHASGALDSKREYIDRAAAGQLARQRGEAARATAPLRLYAGHTALRTSRTTILGTRLRNVNVFVKLDDAWRLASSQSTALPARPVPAAIDARLLARYVGEYEISASRSLTIALEAGVLVGWVPLRPKFELIARADTAFTRHRDEGGYGDVIIFSTDGAGAVTHALLLDGDRIVWRAAKRK